MLRLLRPAAIAKMKLKGKGTHWHCTVHVKKARPSKYKHATKAT
jgi:hypothetical protein